MMSQVSNGCIEKIKDRQFSFAMSALIFLLVIGSVTRILVGLHTNLVFEDALITVRYSRNLFEHGEFAYNLGERVLGTTSPFWTIFILPLASLEFSLLSFLVLVLGTIFTISAIVFVLLAFQNCGITIRDLLPAAIFLVLYMSFIEMSGSGMETALFILLLALSVFFLVRARFGMSALCVGLAVLTRPEGMILLIAWGLTVAVTQGFWKATRGVAIAISVLVPWIVFATYYFGSPLPQSVFAKSSYSVLTPSFLEIFWAPLQFSRLWQTFSAPFLETQPLLNGGITLILASMFLVGSASFLVSESRKPLMIFPLYFVGTVLFFYLGRGAVFPWYALAPLFCFWLTMTVGVAFTVRLAVSSGRFQNLIWGGLCVVAILFITGVSYKRFEELTRTAAETEKHLRIPIGLYLKDRVGEQQTVMLEPLGYIGYFSGARVVDLAGLVTPQITTLRRDAHNGWAMAAIRSFQPDFIVLRSYEISQNKFFAASDMEIFQSQQERNEFERQYDIERSFEWENGGYTIYRRTSNVQN